VTSGPFHARTAAWLAGGSLAIFALTVLPPIFAALFGKSFSKDAIDYIERIAAMEIGPIGAIFGFYFSRNRD
jgi:ABC-type Mn2+/Zn2+ transport system permease subunit